MEIVISLSPRYIGQQFLVFLNSVFRSVWNSSIDYQKAAKLGRNLIQTEPSHARALTLKAVHTLRLIAPGNLNVKII